jgi:hypothetical protein
MAEFPPLAAIPSLTLHESITREHIDASQPVCDWLASLQASVTEKNTSSLASLFLDKESWWRDFVVLTWDIACKNGAHAITNLLSSSTAGLTDLEVDVNPAMAPRLVDMGGMLFLQSGFTFKNDFGTGRGILRLVNVGPSEWKAWTVFANLERLYGQTEVDMIPGKVNVISKGITNHVANDLQVLVVGGGTKYRLPFFQVSQALLLTLSSRSIRARNRRTSQASWLEIFGCGKIPRARRDVESTISINQIAHGAIQRPLSVSEIR